MLGLSEALWDKLEPHGIGVTAVCPGVIDTPITGKARLVGEMSGARETIVSGYSPERVAANILKAVQRNRIVAPISPESWMGYYMKRFAPWASRRLARKMRESTVRSAAG